jgi:peptidoglycan hydrolase-like protein with peptidoglycan-binding domain
MRSHFRAPAVSAVAVLVIAPAAHAACPVRVSTVRGAAPLRVVFRATCTSATYRWAFGDGRIGYGSRVSHTYAGGRFTPTLTTASGTQRIAPVTSVALTLIAPRRADYAQKVIVRARVKPQMPVRLGGRTFHHARLTLTVTEPLLTAVAGPAVVRRRIVVRPRLDVRLEGARTIGSSLHVVAVLRPAHAGSLRVTVDGMPTTHVETAGIGTARIVVLSTPRPSWAAVSRVVRAHVSAPTLALGSHGPAVVALEQRLRELHYALPNTRGVFDDDLQAAVYAFQDVLRQDPTGIVTPRLWTDLAEAAVPKARYPGSHVEVDKARQVLFLVRDGKVALVSHVSTGATGNTPVGLWRVYSKVPGWSWVLWYPSYFLRGFAIHGYPDVPPYPASHGCVRIPMWLAPKIYPEIPMGSAIYIYT